MAKGCVITCLYVFCLVYNFLDLLRETLKQNLEILVVAQSAGSAVLLVSEVHRSEVFIWHWAGSYHSQNVNDLRMDKPCSSTSSRASCTYTHVALVS